MGQTLSSKTADEIADEKMLAWQDDEVHLLCWQVKKCDSLIQQRKLLHPETVITYRLHILMTV